MRSIAVIVGLTIGASTAWADQSVTLGAVTMTVSIPDGWVHETQDGTDAFTHADTGGYIGSFASLPIECAKVLANVQATQLDEVAVTPLEGWSGFDHADGDRKIGTYCRDVDIMAKYAAIVSGYVGEVEPLVAAISAAIDAQEGVYEKFKPENQPDAETRHELRLFTVESSIQAPTNWTADYSEGWDWLKRHGVVVAKVGDWKVDCARATRTVAPKDVPGWYGAEGDGVRGYCHDSGLGFVWFEEGQVQEWLLLELGVDLERRRIDMIATPFEKLGPDRFELGFGRFDPDPDDLLVEEGWGVAAVAAKTPWRQKPGLTWSYQARLAATSPGVPWSLEAGAGATLQLLAVQAIAGAGASGDRAPFSAYAGFQGDLLIFRGIAGFDFSISHVWREGGTTTRLQGGFLLGSWRTWSLSFGWESRLETSLVTINLSMMKLPGFYTD